MKIIQQNSPIMIGWFAYYVYKIALSMIYNFVILYFNLHASMFHIIISIIFWLLFEFLAFVTSANWIVFPLVKRNNKIVELPNLKSLAIECVLLGIYVFFYGSLPVMLLNVFFSLDVFTVSEKTGKIISFIWHTFISFLGYRIIFLNYSSPVKNTANNEDMTQIPAS